MIELIEFLVAVFVLIVFVSMAISISQIVKLLRDILKELKDANDPLKKKARQFDAENTK